MVENVEAESKTKISDFFFFVQPLNKEVIGNELFSIYEAVPHPFYLI